MYLDGRGVRATRHGGRLFRAGGGRSGQIDAIYNLALLYLDGKVRPHDEAKAAQLLAARGQGRQCRRRNTRSASLYDDGRGVAQDETAATRWYAEAAALGHIPAQVEYAIRLFNGIGIAKDEAAAARWFERAAEAGNPIAQNRLARILAAGAGLPADPVAAAKWHYLAQRRRQVRRLARRVRRAASPTSNARQRRRQRSPAMAGD